MNQFLSKCLDKNSQVDVIYTDFSKAFDCIDHYVLIQKLSNFGYSHSLIKLFESYLINRTQFVEYQNVRSRLTTPTSGVPQGSNLGPLLFLLFINDLPSVLSCHKLLFADDVKVYNEIASIDDCRSLQESINALVNWCSVNRLNLNMDKCSVISFTKKLKKIIYNYTTQIHHFIQKHNGKKSRHFVQQ